MDYKVPGVYVEELNGLSLSIQTGETAVPVFAFEGDHTWLSAHMDGVTAFSSWLDVVTLTKSANNLDTDLLYQSLKLYFINGGGHCYVAPVDKLSALVPALDDVTLLVQAGVKHDSFKSQVAILCKPGQALFALFDGPQTEMATAAAVGTEQGNYPDQPQAAVYYPWLTVPGTTTDIPPSGAVAGAYARVDRQRGVWKAPANVDIIGATPKYKVSDDVAGTCNVPAGGRAINVIRAFRGTGPLIWGARTLSAQADTWRYVPVRRLFNAAERDIRMAMSMALFEPNSAPTWERVRGAVESYVHGLWQQGALLGESPQQAYFVQIGLGTTMTQTDINQGRMIVKVGLAAVRPAEFIVLQLTQDVVPG
ncbi:phage tail sheath subtilisin-like domain-containing protein (plasmid) [Serratia marcescens]|uniref:phage tail sheath family protein n=1 Tax=Serratia TaxID=613 RepID=UPI002570D5D4|nr:MULTISPECIES: phage tail sheath C-terminal domain-containing protein [Serratia]MDM1819179.1 phage tail sheath subtilisin-like domain-containing protein [Serratia ureilytica]WJD90517.1 phage tail sheath subtilisin-like domain-containing protein [Serratia marcescens]